MKKLFAVFIIVLRGLDATAGGDHAGNGGDPLQKLFLEARTYAANRVKQIKKCSFSNSTPQAVQDWILAHRAELVSDLVRTQQIWITDKQSTCAWTQPHEASDVTLSFESCRPLIKTVEDAAHLLIHESTHHFGITNENFPEEIATALDLADLKATCAVDTGDPFNPDACPGNPITTKEFLNYFAAGGKAVRFNDEANMVSRHRKCLGQTEDLCTDWQYSIKNGPTSATLKTSLQFSIEDMKPKATVYFDYNNSSDIRGAYVDGIMTDKVEYSVILPWFGTGGSGSDFHFKSTGRMTNGCFVSRSKIDMEHEAGFILSFD